ncbi:MAG: hypothetical protein RLZZ156_1575 [Deinococcota bacterium]|jgi:hypothetical protein
MKMLKEKYPSWRGRAKRGGVPEKLCLESPEKNYKELVVKGEASPAPTVGDYCG